MKMIPRIGWLYCSLGLALGASQAFAETDHPKRPDPPRAKVGADAPFVREAATAGLAEVELGRLGAAKATRAEIKSLAKMMVEDHRKANAELRSLAGKDLAFPAEPAPDQKAEKARLEKLSGAAFDDAFMKTMVKDHQKAVSLFSKEAGSGSDEQLKSWAQKTLPTIKEHLARAQDVSRGKTASVSDGH